MDKTLDHTVLNMYDYIFSRPVAEQSSLLNAWWALLGATCTPDEPCIECRRELESLEREIYYATLDTYLESWGYDS
jgi:hypothetical protein